MREDPRVSESSGRGRDRLETGLVLLLFVASGVAALIYEVLWLKELGRLFGVTAHAAATTLAVFFVGLAAGGFVWGRRASRMAHPLRTYGLLELATALTAVAYFFILAFYRAVYSALFTAVGDHPLLLQGAKVGLAFGVLFLPAFFMGGTLPVMGQFLVRHPRHLGRKASLLYAANTVGAALGAFLAGFYLPVALGFKAAYLVPIALNLVVGGVALVWSRRHETARAATAPAPVVEPTAGVASEGAGAGRYGLVWTAAVVSGFTTLGLEVLWIRMFGQVLQNSVYTFAALLTVFLLALGLGSGLAHLLCRRPWSPWSVLFTLLTLSGLLVGLTPWAFYRTTSGLEVLEGATGWSGYITTVFVRVAGVILIPGAVLGCVFPYLMKLSEGWTRSPGRTIGQLAAANTGAAILGSLTAGFVLLDGLGLWASIRLMAVIDLALAALVLPGFSRSRMALRALPLACVVLFGTVVTYSGFADAHVEPGETLLQVWEGSDGTVAVVRRGEDLRMKFNNSYTLGSSASAMLHRRHAWMPLSLHPEPRTAFYLGMGTGLSAGAALDFPLRRVSVSEISPGIVEAARRHFAPHLNGLFEDPRVELLQEDGRSYLYVTSRRFDVIVADLFLPWKAGTGSLYSKEHFETVLARLAPGGLFAQWLPMAQVGSHEFGMIARTMLEVFPQVTVWRRDFSLPTPALALIARGESRPLDNEVFEGHLEKLAKRGRIREGSWLGRIPQAAYAGNLTAASSLFARYPLNTDDRPRVEYRAPISHREAAAGGGSGLTGDALSSLFTGLFDAQPPLRDPYLAELGPAEIGRVLAGRELYDHLVARQAGRSAEARLHLERFRQLTGVSARFAN
jgi:spermidine synthase